MGGDLGPEIGDSNTSLFPSSIFLTPSPKGPPACNANITVEINRVICHLVHCYSLVVLSRSQKSFYIIVGMLSPILPASVRDKNIFSGGRLL